MEKISSWIRIFFGFSRTETNGFLILLPLMTLILFSAPTYRWWRSSQPQDFSRDARAMDSLMAQLHWDTKDSTTTSVKKLLATAHFESFDPNTATEQAFSQMGLSGFLTKRIIRYREKGGSFRKKEDVLKIYGMDSSWYDQAQGWMTFPPKKIPKPFEKRVTNFRIEDINEADSLQLLRIYGIGPALSRRIRTFRDRLGGFISLNQLQEVYGLDTAVVREMKKKFVVRDEFLPRQIKLNTATLEDLIHHPYIKRREALAILSYRLQHGAFQAFEELLEINLLTPQWIDRVQPYLTLTE